MDWKENWENVKDYFKELSQNEDAMRIAKYFIIAVITVFSAVTSLQLTTSSFKNQYMAYMLTTIIEGSLIIASYNFHKKRKWYLFLLWFAYGAVSIIGAMGAMLGTMDDMISVKYHNAPEYIKYLDDVKKNNDLIATYQNGINKSSGSSSMTSNADYIKKIDADILKARTEKAALPPNNITKRADYDRAIEGLKDDRQRAIDRDKASVDGEANKQAEIKNLTSQIANLKTDNINLKAQMEKDLVKNGSTSNAYKLAMGGLPVSEHTALIIIFVLVEITRFIFLHSNKIEGLSPTQPNPDPTKKKKPEIEVSESENKSPTLSDKKGNLGHLTAENSGQILGQQDNKIQQEIQDKKEENVPSWDGLKSSVPRSGKIEKNVPKESPKISQKEEEKVSEIDVRKCFNFGIKYSEKHGKFPSRATIMKEFDWRERRARKAIEELQKKDYIGTTQDGIIKKTLIKKNKKGNAM